jgi:predicted nucleic acid-binding protein
MSGAKTFFDTNVQLFAEYSRSDRILLSTQVVQEFYAAGSQKLAMPKTELRQATLALADLPLVIVDTAQISAAIDLEDRYSVSFWDALILAAAQSGGADVLFTEDLNHGQQYGSVLVRNPFRGAALP